jgi:hypothetical protein
MSVLVMMAAVVDTHDGSVDTLIGSVFVSKMSKHYHQYRHISSQPPPSMK